MLKKSDYGECGSVGSSGSVGRVGRQRTYPTNKFSAKKLQFLRAKN
ncbi:MAG: hypothetical protein AB4080_24725 [Trichodesmium sp.]